MLTPLSVRQRLACVVAAIVLCAGALATRFFETSPMTIIPAAAVADISVDPKVIHAVVPATAFGVNTAVWDPHLLDKPVPSLLRRAGVSLLRFPGGSSADDYHWAANAFTGGGHPYPADTFDAFMDLARRVGAQPLITVNYGSNAAGTRGGDPAEAAAWVRYANRVKGYGVRYWEIGNEVYDNGSYGPYVAGLSERDLHREKGPAAYARNALAYIDTMKAVDPSIQVGVAVTTPGYWPEGQRPDWDGTILPVLCHGIDFVDVHWYANDNRGGDADLLRSTGRIAGMMSALRRALVHACGAAGRRIAIMLGETNTDSTGKQRVSLVNALFLADGLLTWLENGAANASWWDLHNGLDTGGNISPALYGTATYGDLGLLSSGNALGTTREPPANAPFPPYYGLRMLALLARPDGHMVAATSRQAQVAVHAVRQADGGLTVLLIDRSPRRGYNLTIDLGGYAPASRAAVYSYGLGSAAIKTGGASGVARTFRQYVAPYSLTALVLRPATAGLVPRTPTLRPRPAPISTGATAPASPPTTTSVAPTPVMTMATTATAITATIGFTPTTPVPATLAPAATIPATPAPATATPDSTATVPPDLTAAGSTATPSAGAVPPTLTPAAPTISASVPPGQDPAPSVTMIMPALPTTTTIQTPPALTIRATDASVAPLTVTSGLAATLRATLTASAPLTGTVVDFYVYDAAGRLVAQTWRGLVGFTAGVPHSLSAAWVVPPTLARGAYTLRIGVFGPSWSPLYAWIDTRTTVSVTTR